MRFRVLGVVAVMFGGAVSITGRAGAQADAGAAPPKAVAPEPTQPPQSSRAAFPPVEQAAPPAPPAAAPSATAPSATAPSATRPSTRVIESQEVRTLPLREPEPQAYFGFGAQIGFYNPNGVTMRVGVPAISLEGTVGFVPVLLSYGDSQRPDLKFLMPFEVSPQLVIHVVTFRNEVRGNLLLGYRYNAALGHASTLGGSIEKRVSRHWLLEGIWGLSYYPDAADRLRGDQLPQNAHFNFPPELGYGLSVGLLFYP